VTRELIACAALVACTFMSGCVAANALRAPEGFANLHDSVRAHIVYVGGNSQHCDGNQSQLLGIWREVAQDVAAALNLQLEQIDRHYYSWTGETFDPRRENCLPNPLRDNIWYGENHIEGALADQGVLADASKPLIIVGYSNGGATAFDVAARLCRNKRHPVSLLVTLDPVSRLTRRADTLGAETWLNVYVDRHDAVIFTGGPWRGNAPEARLNRLVHPARHGNVHLLWDAVSESDAFGEWGARTRSLLSNRQIATPRCTFIGSR
jgi:hypothetical protein